MRYILKKYFLFLLFCVNGFFIATYAAVPIVDYSSSSSGRMSNEAISYNSGTTNNMIARLSRLENQVNNLNQQHFNSKLDNLQQRLQVVMGKLEEQSYQIKKLKEQLRNFYQDLDKRIDKTKSNKFVGNTSDKKLNSHKTLNYSSSSETASLKEKQLYQSAIDLLPSRKYESSANKLKEYIEAYPKGVYVSNAHYWLGEIYFLQKKYDNAKAKFNTVLNKYPNSKKVPDAMLKLAIIDDIKGNHTKASDMFKKIKKQFPNSSAAQLAKKQLQK